MKTKLLIINVLNYNYYEDCHIPGSINIPHDEFEEHIAELDKHHAYVIYCAKMACPLSRQCAQMLIDEGFTRVWAYEEGIIGWYQKGYPVDGPAQLDYLDEEITTQVAISDGIPVITAEQLLEKMAQFGFNL